MSFNELPFILSVILTMISIPIVSSTISYVDDYPARNLLNDSYNLTLPSKVSKSVTENGIFYSYKTPYGEYSISITPEKVQQTLLRIGKKVSSVQGVSEQVWEISLPSESLKINHSEQRVVEIYRNINGYLRITLQNGYPQFEMSGTATQEELREGMFNLERELNQSINLMKEMSEHVLNFTEEESKIKSNVVINEFELNPKGADSGNEWIELYNPTQNIINISGWRIYNKNLDSKKIPENTTIEPGSYYVLNTTGLNLYNANEQLILKDNENIIDITPVKSDESNNNKCWARVPNGYDTDSDSDWSFQICTKGASNNG